MLKGIFNDESICSRVNISAISRYFQDATLVLGQLDQGKVLDLGAGAGVFSILLSRLGFDVTATNNVDENSSVKENWHTHFVKFDVQFFPFNMNYEPLPFSDNIFDAVLFLHVIEHLDKPYFALSEIRRILRPGGKLILTTPNQANLLNRVKLLFGKSIYHPIQEYFHSGTFGGHVREYTLKELLFMLNDTRFNIIYKSHSYGYEKYRLSSLKGSSYIAGILYTAICKTFPPFGSTLSIVAKK